MHKIWETYRKQIEFCTVAVLLFVLFKYLIGLVAPFLVAAVLMAVYENRFLSETKDRNRRTALDGRSAPSDCIISASVFLVVWQKNARLWDAVLGEAE